MSKTQEFWPNIWCKRKNKGGILKWKCGGGGKLERIDMLYTIPEFGEAADSVFKWAKLLSNKSEKTMCPTYSNRHDAPYHKSLVTLDVNYYNGFIT